MQKYKNCDIYNIDIYYDHITFVYENDFGYVRKRMNLHQLEYIVALDIHRNHAKAADHCHVTQPTLSMQVQKLEAHLGMLAADGDDAGLLVVGRRGIDHQTQQVVHQTFLAPEMEENERVADLGTLRDGAYGHPAEAGPRRDLERSLQDLFAPDFDRYWIPYHRPPPVLIGPAATIRRK